MLRVNQRKGRLCASVYYGGVETPPFQTRTKANGVRSEAGSRPKAEPAAGAGRPILCAMMAADFLHRLFTGGDSVCLKRELP